MNAISEVTVSPATLEHVLGTGDLSKLSTPQRVEYYARTCTTLGLNPLTRPFRFLALNGQIQLYATRDATDQLRKVNGITLHITNQRTDGDLFIVTVRARSKDGREDEDIGAVTLGQLRGESRANALMKALTKAKRRVTLSICGLGLTDESELDTMPGAATFDADQTPPAAPVIEAEPTAPPPAPEPKRTKLTISEWLDALKIRLDTCATQADVDAIVQSADVRKATGALQGKALEELNAMIHAALERTFDAEPASNEITPADRLMSG